MLVIWTCSHSAARAEPRVIVPEPGFPGGSTCANRADVAKETESAFERAFRLRCLGVDAPESDGAPGSDAEGALPVSSSPVQPGSNASIDPLASPSLPSTVRMEAAPASSKDDDEPGIPHHPSLTDRFFFGIGAFSASSTTEARLNSPSGVGTTVGFEDLLGLDNNKFVPQGLARWRMSDRWRLELEFFRLDRSNSKAIGQDIVWGDQTFPAGFQIDSQFNVSVTRLSAGYSFFKTQDKEFGIALGFHLTDIGVELSGGGANSDSGDLLAPLPVLSMYGQVALTDKWAFAGRIDAFRVAYSPYEGHIYSLGMDVLYQPWRHVGMGFGWRSLEFELSASSHDWDGAVRSVFQGPIAFISCSF
jgi:hypothetical protein